MDCLYSALLDHSKRFTLHANIHSFTHTHTHVHTLMAEAAVQGADLLIRSDTKGSIKGSVHPN